MAYILAIIFFLDAVVAAVLFLFVIVQVDDRFRRVCRAMKVLLDEKYERP